MAKEILRKIAHFQVKYPVFSLLILIMFTIMIWGGISKVNTVASLELMMPKTQEEISAFNDLRDNGLGQDMIAIIISVNPNSQVSNPVTSVIDKRVYNYINDLSSELSKEIDVLQINSYSQIVDMYNYQNLDYNEFIKDGVPEEFSNFVNSDQSTTMMLIQTDIATDDTRMNMLSNKIKIIAEDMGDPAEIKLSSTGTPIIQQKIGNLINKDRNSTLWISTMLVFLVTILIFRSFTSALVPIIIVFVSVNWLYGTMGYASVPISTLSGGVAAMVIGIGIDFAIHIMNKFKFERSKGSSIQKSIELALTHTGMALFATAATTIAAFMAFLIGVMPEMGRFGLLMSIGILYSLIFSIFGLPTLLILEEKIIYYMKKKMRFGIDSEFKLEETKK